MSAGEKIDFALVNAERLRREPQTAILNEHRHLHGLAKLGEVDCAELERIHTMVVDEMTRRGLEHSSPLVCGGEKGIRQLFSSPGGKRAIASKLVSLIPPHKTYVEGFAGGGAVFFAKEPSEVEVLNDADPEIAHAYKFARDATDEEIKKLSAKNWRGSKSTWNEVESSKPSSDIDKVYRFGYMMLMSRGDRASYRSARDGETINFAERIPKVRERLKGVKVFQQDYQDILKKFDAPDTFFYLDPPYDKEWSGPGDSLSPEALAKALKGVKGKWLVSYADTQAARNAFKGSEFKTISMPRFLQNREGNEAVSQDRELLIANYDLHSSQKAGLKLNEPHAYLIWKGKKKSIALPADDGKGLDGHLVGVPLVLCQNGAAGAEAYGEAILGNPAAMTPAQFDLPEYADCHCVRPEERREWWDGVKQFYVYPIKSFVKYEHPRPVLLQSGCKCYLPDVRFKQYTPPTDKERAILAQSEKLPKQIILTPRAVSLTGSMLYGNHEPRDVDVVVVGAEWREDEGQFVVPLTPTFKEKLERVLRAVYQTGNAVQYISEGEGPTFDHLPLYALALVRLPRLEVEHVSEMEPDTAELAYDKDGAKALTATAIERELRGASPTVRRQALQSYTDDAVLPGRSFVPLKPMRPAKEGQRQVMDGLFEMVDFKTHPKWFSSTKRDGIRLVISRSDGKVKIMSDDGTDLTENLPESVKVFDEIPSRNFVLDAECEKWIGNQHFPREAVTAAVHKREESNLVFNIFDVLYWD